ncbi:MAG: FhaA domain-containing protein [Acidimicrobiia bacterium]
MKLARQLERRLEDALDHLAGKIFRGGLHVSELAARVAREAELAEFNTAAGPATANRYSLLINPENLDGDPAPLARRLQLAFDELAAERGWRLQGPVVIELRTDESVTIGAVSSAASVEVGPILCWAQLTDEEGRVALINHNRAIIGRSLEADVVIDYPEVSRTHALIFRQDGQTYVADLGSSNGTWVDGQRVGTAPVPANTLTTLNLGSHSLRLTPCRN